MKLFEPFQRLDLAGYNMKDNAIYVKSTLSTLLPEKSTLLGKDPVINRSPLGSATIDYFHQTDDAVTDIYIFEQIRLVKVLENVLNKEEMTLTGRELTSRLNGAVKAKYGGSLVAFYSVTAHVYTDKSAIGGQVTTTIAQSGDVAII
jgi:hypothetical protein